MENVKRNFKGVWIPREVYLHPELTLAEKFLLTEISSLENENGCFASNEYLAGWIGKSEKTVANMLTNLVRLGLISVDGKWPSRTITTKLGSVSKGNTIDVESKSQNRDLTPSKSQNRDYKSQNRDYKSQNRDLHIKDIKRDINTDDDVNAISIYREGFKNFQLTIYNEELLASLELEDPEAFRDAVHFWAARQYNPTSISKIIELYKTKLAEKRVVARKSMTCELCEAYDGMMKVEGGFAKCTH